MNPVVFTKVHTANRGTSTYKAEGYPGVIQLAKPAFNGVHPDTLSVNDVPDSIAPVRAPKVSKEERKAAREAEAARVAAMSPAEKAAYKVEQARLKFEAAQARAAKLAGGSTENLG
jgi:hypothetical protein